MCGRVAKLLRKTAEAMGVDVRVLKKHYYEHKSAGSLRKFFIKCRSYISEEN